MAIKDVQKKIKDKYQLNQGFSTHKEVTVKQAITQAEQNNVTVDAVSSVPEMDEISRQQPQKPSYDRKVTCYLTEALYKTFNDIYATRLLKGRATEKAALMCEAVKLLCEKEKADGHI